MSDTAIGPNLNPSPALMLSPPVAGRGAKAAREFEAELLGSLLELMEKTFATLPGGDATAGAENYNFLATHALAETIAAHGGFGIARMLSSSLEPHEGMENNGVAVLAK